MSRDEKNHVMEYFLSIDSNKCQGHNRCYNIAPELFDVDDFGLATLRSPGALPPELLGKARLAMQNCPEFAISLAEDA